MTKKKQTAATYEQMGVAALLPGMRHMMERMRREMAEMEALLAALQEGEQPEAFATGKGKGGWPADPAERKAEAARRWASRKRNAAASNGLRDRVAPRKRAASHPRDADHPDHAAWVEKVKAANRKTWAKYTPEQRAARIKRSIGGRAA